MHSHLLIDHIALGGAWLLILFAHLIFSWQTFRLCFSATACCNIRTRHSICYAIAMPISSFGMPLFSHMSKLWTTFKFSLVSMSVLKFSLINLDHSNPLCLKFYPSQCLVTLFGTVGFINYIFIYTS